MMIQVSSDQVDLLLVLACNDGRNTVEKLALARLRAEADVLIDIDYLKGLGLVKGSETLEFDVDGYAKVLCDWWAEIQDLNTGQRLECDAVFTNDDFKSFLASFVKGQGKLAADVADGRTWFGFGGVNRKTFKEMFTLPILMFISLSKVDETIYNTYVFRIMQESTKSAPTEGMIVSGWLTGNRAMLRKLAVYQRVYPRALTPLMKVFGR